MIEESGELYRELIEQMKEQIKMSEEISTKRDEAHRTADGILTRWLDHLGYKELTDLFWDVDKWYS